MPSPVTRARLWRLHSCNKLLAVSWWPWSTRYWYKCINNKSWGSVGVTGVGPFIYRKGQSENGEGQTRGGCWKWKLKRKRGDRLAFVNKEGGWLVTKGVFGCGVCAVPKNRLKKYSTTLRHVGATGRRPRRRESEAKVATKSSQMPMEKRRSRGIRRYDVRLLLWGWWRRENFKLWWRRGLRGKSLIFGRCWLLTKVAKVRNAARGWHRKLTSPNLAGHHKGGFRLPNCIYLATIAVIS